MKNKKYPEIGLMDEDMDEGLEYDEDGHEHVLTFETKKDYKKHNKLILEKIYYEALNNYINKKES